MFNRILIGLCFAVLCISIPFTFKLQPKVIERTVERNIIVEGSVQGDLEQKLNQWFMNFVVQEMEKLEPQIQNYYQEKINALCKKREQELRTLLRQFRQQGALIFENYVEQQDNRRSK